MRSRSAFSMKGLVTSRRAVAAASCVASLATRVLRCTCKARYNTDKTTAIEPINCEIALIASQFQSLPRFVGNLENDLPARVTSCDLFVGFPRLGERQRLRNNYPDFLFID